MATDLTVRLSDEPGTLGTMGRALGDAGINIEGVGGIPFEGTGIIHVLVADDDSEAAQQALQAAGITVGDAREVVVLDVSDADQPGVLGRLATKLAEEGMNIEFVYLATGTRVVFGVDDPERARSLLG